MIRFPALQGHAESIHCLSLQRKREEDVEELLYTDYLELTYLAQEQSIFSSCRYLAIISRLLVARYYKRVRRESKARTQTAAGGFSIPFHSILSKSLA
jgi:hypothetical protein